MQTNRLLAASLALAAGTTLAGFGVRAKTPGGTHCYNSICHRVMTLVETQAEVGAVKRVIASFYDLPHRDAYNPSTATSSGETFRADRPDNAASPVYPDGTKLLIWSEASGIAAVVRINNAGPYHPGRLLDVSRAVAERLGFASAGIARLHVVVIEAPSSADASYVRGRRYAALPGVIGRFQDIETAARSITDETPGSMSGSAPIAAETTAADKPAYSLTTRVLARAPPRRPKHVAVRTATRQPDRAAAPPTRPTASWTAKFYD